MLGPELLFDPIVDSWLVLRPRSKPQCAQPEVLLVLLPALGLPEAVQKALTMCLHPDPEQRPDLAGVAALEFSQPNYTGLNGWLRPLRLEEALVIPAVVNG
jgi:hypothetical protein